MEDKIYIIRYNINSYFNYLCNGIYSYDQLVGYIDCASFVGAITKDERSFIFKAGLFV